MSRRKQSNPKPLKRPADEEEGEGKDTLEPLDLSERYKLPPDILELQACDEEGRELTVCGAIRLPRGSSLGPFQASLMADDTVDDDMEIGPIIQFSDSLGKVTSLRMGENARWLSLLKRKDRDTANCSVYFDGERLWCEIRRDVLIHSELTAVFSTEPLDTVGLPQPEPPGLLYKPALSYTPELPRTPEQPCSPERPCSPDTTNGNIELRGRGVRDYDQSPKIAIADPITSPQSPPSEQTAHPLIYPCPFCCVRFSSPRTLDAHIQFYCSKKPISLAIPPGFHPHPTQLSPVPDERRNGLVTEKDSRGLPLPVTNASPGSTKGDKRSSSRSTQDSGDEVIGQGAKKVQHLKCDMCSYTAARANSMTRHKRIHNRPVVDKSDNESMSPVSLSEMYCIDCNIQFSSMNTYRGHKEYYCPRRSSADPPISPGQRISRDGNSTDASENKMSSSPCSKMKDEIGRGVENSIYSGMGGIVVPAQFLSQTIPISVGNQPAVLLTAPMLASSGMANITMPAIIMQPVVQRQDERRASSPPRRSERISPKRLSPPGPPEPSKDTAELPLDLSTKRPDADKEPNGKDKTKPSGTNGIRVKLENGGDQLSPKSNFQEGLDARKPGTFATKSEPCSPTRERQRAESSMSSSSLNNEPPQIALRSPNMLDANGEKQFMPNRSQYMMYGDFSFFHGPNGRLIANPSQMYGPLLHEADPECLQNSHFAGLSAMGKHVSKCMECNIVFYKHENYMIHKKHYCASRKRKRRSSGEQSIPPDSGPESPSDQDGTPNGPLNYEPAPKTPKKTKSPEISSPEGVSGSSPHNTVFNNAVYQRYYCTSCCIKFSSADTLKAHKDFYCLDRKSSDEKSHDEDEALAEKVPRDKNLRDRRPVTGNHSCSNCSNSYPSARLLKLHFCKNNKSKVSLLRCLYCDFVAQTESKYVDHMKAHAPSKVYRCAICGYRGNTVRGMRMHGKMHVDEGHEFTDEHMVEYEEPPQLPATLSNGSEVGPVDVEVELIRLKNEPYKRRRSRKSYEKSEYRINPPKTDRHVCSICFDVYPDAGKLSDHMQLHMAESKYGCRSCDFSTDSKVDLVDHMLSVHGPSSKDLQSEGGTSDQNFEKSGSAAFRKLNDNEETNGYSHLEQLPKTPRSSSPESPASSGEPKEPSKGKSPNDEAMEMDIEPGNSPEKENVPVSVSTTISHSRSSPDSRNPVTISQLDENENSEVLPKYDKPGPKYCKYCDINFTFLSSFLAHRRYYCTSRYNGDLRDDVDNFSVPTVMRVQH